jgi:hypothetical protein
MLNCFVRTYAVPVGCWFMICACYGSGYIVRFCVRIKSVYVAEDNLVTYNVSKGFQRLCGTGRPGGKYVQDNRQKEFAVSMAYVMISCQPPNV